MTNHRTIVSVPLFSLARRYRAAVASFASLARLRISSLNTRVVSKPRSFFALHVSARVPTRSFSRLGTCTCSFDIMSATSPTRTASPLPTFTSVPRASGF